MQKIAFRAWHKEHKLMFPVYTLRWDHANPGILNYISTCFECPDVYDYAPDEVELMQSTNLLSKDSVEIFEGDILCYDFGGGTDTYLIERSIYSNQLIARYLYLHGDWEHLDDAPLECSVILGNRWANPELMGEQDGN